MPDATPCRRPPPPPRRQLTALVVAGVPGDAERAADQEFDGRCAGPPGTAHCHVQIQTAHPRSNAPLTRSPLPQPGKKRKGGQLCPGRQAQAAGRRPRLTATNSDSDGGDSALSDSSLSSLRLAAVQDLLLLLSAPLFSLHGHTDPLQNLITAAAAADLPIGSEPAATRSHTRRAL